jgi:hypothetical protein
LVLTILMILLFFCSHQYYRKYVPFDSRAAFKKKKKLLGNSTQHKPLQIIWQCWYIWRINYKPKSSQWSEWGILRPRLLCASWLGLARYASKKTGSQWNILLTHAFEILINNFDSFIILGVRLELTWCDELYLSLL